MSRIIQDRVDAGDSIDATDLNTRFADYSQAGALDTANHAQGSVDLPQVRGQGLITLNQARGTLGTGSWDHSTVQNIPSTTVSPAVLAEVGGGTTRLTFGAGGWTINPGEILRVYWDIGANPIITGRPYAAPGVGTRSIDDGAGGGFDLNDCLACWIAHLQWDTTSSALGAFGSVSGQDDYRTGTPGRAGVTAMAAQSIIPAWLEYSAEGNAVDGTTNARTQKDIKWGGVSGSYFFANDPAGSPITVYGLRIVAHGIYHVGFAGSSNYLELDTGVGGVGQKLELSIGQITALHQRMS